MLTHAYAPFSALYEHRLFSIGASFELNCLRGTNEDVWRVEMEELEHCWWGIQVTFRGGITLGIEADIMVTGRPVYESRMIERKVVHLIGELLALEGEWCFVTFIPTQKPY